ncbi:MAG: hypothetical protein L0H98_11435, partial [Lacticaseibacillus paracasei]|nr:hypothetical protein [Lacticaseibacillus paracasei]
QPKIVLILFCTKQRDMKLTKFRCENGKIWLISQLKNSWLAVSDTPGFSEAYRWQRLDERLLTRD